MEWNVSLHHFIFQLQAIDLQKRTLCLFTFNVTVIAVEFDERGNVRLSIFWTHSTFRFEFPLQTFVECSLLKGQVFWKKPGRDIFQSDTLETIRLPGSRRQIPKMLSQIIRLKFILVPSYLSCKLEEFDFLVGLIRRRCSRNVQGTGRFQRIAYKKQESTLRPSLLWLHITHIWLHHCLCTDICMFAAR